MSRAPILLFILGLSILSVFGYALFLLCIAVPLDLFSMEKAGQFGDSFGAITCFFSGLAVAGALLTIRQQGEALKRAEEAHAHDTRLNALAALLSVYDALANARQGDLYGNIKSSDIPNETGRVGEGLKAELDELLRKRDLIYKELEDAAGIK